MVDTRKIFEVIYRFKFTLIYTSIFFYLGGAVLGVPAVIGGLFVDLLINKESTKEQYNKGYKTNHYWFIYAFFTAFFYTWVIYANIDKYTIGGIVYEWIEFTKPFTNKIAEYIPIIDNYSEQISALGDSWRVPKIRHLYAVFWFTNIIAAPLLFNDVLCVAKYMCKNLVKKIKECSDPRRNIRVLNFSMLFVILMFSLIVVSLGADAVFYGREELLEITYKKGRYVHLPFVMFFSLFILAVIAPSLLLINIQRNKLLRSDKNLNLNKTYISQIEYAGFWRRLIANLLDLFLLLLFVLLLSGACKLYFGDNNQILLHASIYFVTFTLIYLFTDLYTYSSLGKRLLNIKIVSKDGGNISFNQALSVTAIISAWLLLVFPFSKFLQPYSFAAFLLGITLFLIFNIPIVVGKYSLALHDKVCGTRVIKVSKG